MRFFTGRFLIVLCYCILSSSFLNAQLHPENGAHIRYTSVCFEFPWVENALSYELHLTETQTKRTVTCNFLSNKYVVNDLHMGNTYSWYVTARNSRKEVIHQTAVLTFTIDDRDQREDIRFKEVTNNEAKRGNELLVYDYAGIVMNRDLELLWHLPDFPFMRANSGLRDLKLTDDGTFLAIIDSNAYEFDPDGKIIWKAPNNGFVSGGKTEDYHHDFQKLTNGHYMILGNERIRHRFPGQKDSTTYESGTIIEYDSAGKVVWQWHAKDFFTEAMLMRRKREDGSPDPATHLNAFNVAGNFIYAGFRDAGWIVKIDKKTGKVIELYGGNRSGFTNHYGIGLFRFQHDSHVLQDRQTMAVINNDSIRDPNVVSSLVVFSLGKNGTQKGDELFRFPFRYDSLSNGKSTKLGNVHQLASGNYFINMGAINRAIEVTPSGEIVWDVFIEKLDTFKNVWRFFPQYRISTATSLYPNEFSYRWTGKSLKGNQTAGQLTLFNVGSETNSYVVYLKQVDGSLKELKKIPTITPGNFRSVNVVIPTKKGNAPAPETLIVQVYGKSKREQFVVEPLR